MMKIIPLKEPFPHLIVEDVYDEKELKLIWQELNWLIKPGKLLTADQYGGIAGGTNAKALLLDSLYKKRDISNILTISRKIYSKEILDPFCGIHPSCATASRQNYDCTKVRYYHDGEYYDPHTDSYQHFLIFSYFYKEPKRFSGGELFFPQFKYEYECKHNSLIMMPAWVEHGVKLVKIKDSDYYGGYGRYAITHFLNNQEDRINYYIDDFHATLKKNPYWNMRQRNIFQDL